MIPASCRFLSPWPPSSPDLSVLDFYVWPRLARLVEEQNPSDRDCLIIAVKEAAIALNADYLQELQDAFEKSLRARVNLCVESAGMQFEGKRFVGEAPSRS